MNNIKKRNLIILIVIIIIMLLLVFLKVFMNKKLTMVDMETINLKCSLNDSKDYLNFEYTVSGEFKGYWFAISNDGVDLEYRIVIAEDNHLYLFDMSTGDSIQLTNVDARSIYLPDPSNKKALYAYMLDNSGNVYYIELLSTDINKVSINKVPFNHTVINFIDDVRDTGVLNNKAALVLTDDNVIYDLMTNTVYKNNMFNLENEYIIYDDYTIGNNNGCLVKNDNINYEFNFAIKLDDSAMFPGNPDIVLVTNDYYIIYTIDNILYKSKSAIKEFNFKEETDENVQIDRIYFEDGTNVETIGTIYSVDFTVETNTEE